MKSSRIARRSLFAAAYVWFAAKAGAQLAKRVLIHLTRKRKANVAEKAASGWERLRRIPASIAFRYARFLARVHDLPRFTRQVVAAVNRNATASVFDIVAARPDAGEFLADIVDRVGRGGRVGPTMLGCAIGLASKCERTEDATALARQLVKCHADEVGMQQHAGVQAFLASDYATAEYLWNACNRGKQRLAREKRLDRHDLRILGPSWVIAIGHIAHLDIYFKWRELSGRKERLVLTLPVGFRVPNEDLLSRWENRLLPRVPDDIRLTLGEVEIIQDEFWSLELPGRGWHMYSHAGAWVQAEWEKRGGKPLLSLSADDRRRGGEELRALGIPQDAWYVCLHVREPGFHKAWHKFHPGTRNADIMTYVDAVRAVTERGGYVIRMGDASMRPFPVMPGVVDYAHSDSKSEFMDVFLCASCKFLIGTNSGLGLVPPVFGVPCALTNWSPIGLPQWYPNDLFIPKLCRSERLGRLLTFGEMFCSQAGWGQFADYFERERITVLDNSAEDLRQLVLEMLEREEGALRESEEDAALYQAYLRMALPAGSYAGARPGRRFLRKYRELLRDGEAARAPAYRAAPRYAAG